MQMMDEEQEYKCFRDVYLSGDLMKLQKFRMEHPCEYDTNIKLYLKEIGKTDKQIKALTGG